VAVPNKQLAAVAVPELTSTRPVHLTRSHLVVQELALKEAMPSRQVQTRIAAIRSRIDPPLVFMRLLAARLRSVLEVVCLLSSSSRGALPGLWRTILEDDVE
jgi:hypothetical protein